jgi:hypothetical protein
MAVLPQSVTLAIRTGSVAAEHLFSGIRRARLVRTGRLGLELEKQAVDSHAKTTEEKQRREVLRNQWKSGSWQRNLEGITVPGSEIMNYTGKKHVKESAANVLPPVRSATAGQLHLGNRLAAKGTLPQMRSHMLAAIYATQLIRDRSCHCTHTAPRYVSL